MKYVHNLGCLAARFMWYLPGRHSAAPFFGVFCLPLSPRLFVLGSSVSFLILLFVLFLPSFPFFLLRSVAFLASPPCRFSTAGGYGGVPWFRSGFCLSCCLPLCIRYTTSNDTLVVRGRGMALARSLSRFSLGSAAAPPWRVSGRISPLLCMAPKASALCGEASLYTM